MSTNVLQRTLDANSNRIASLGAPTAATDATQVTSTLGDIQNVGAANSLGSSFKAAPADHAHTIGANIVTNAMIRQGAARTVIGVTGNATANVADIAGGGAATFLRDSGTALVFSAILAGDMPAATSSAAGSMSSTDKAKLDNIPDQYKASVRGKTTANLAVTASGTGGGKTLTANANGVFTSDGITWALNDRVLVGHQTTAADNGIYKITTLGTVSTTYVLTRATDFDANSEVVCGLVVRVEEGTAYASTEWTLVTANTITVDTTGLSFRKTAGKPSVIALTDGATIAVDASLFAYRGDIGRVTLGGNRTISNWTNAVDGQQIEVQVKQDGTGTRTLAYDTKYRFSTDVPSPTLTTTINKMDKLLFEYHATDDKFDLNAINKGF